MQGTYGEIMEILNWSVKASGLHQIHTAGYRIFPAKQSDISCDKSVLQETRGPTGYLLRLRVVLCHCTLYSVLATLSHPRLVSYWFHIVYIWLFRQLLGPFYQCFKGHLNFHMVLRPEIWSSPLGQTRPTTLYSYSYSYIGHILYIYILYIYIYYILFHCTLYSLAPFHIQARLVSAGSQLRGLSLESRCELPVSGWQKIHSKESHRFKQTNFVRERKIHKRDFFHH